MDSLSFVNEMLNTNMDDNSQLPKSAMALLDAIQKNRTAQDHLRNQMNKVQVKREELKEVIRRVKVIDEFDSEGKIMCQRKLDDSPVMHQLISVPNTSGLRKLHPPMNHGPMENIRVANYKQAVKAYPQGINKHKWTQEERRNLKKGIIKQVQNPKNRKGNRWKKDLDQGDPKTIRSFLPKVDWEEVAEALPKRSGRECEARWINVEDPLINREKWTTLEDKSLLIHTQQLGHKWDAIAEALGTNRTPFDCLVRYQRSLNPSLIKGDWSGEEDMKLAEAVQAHGESNWTVVATEMEGRTGPQCSNRWMKALHPTKQKKGRWSQDEDERLRIAVMLIGSQCWNKIAEFVEGRTQASCRDRWVGSLDPCLKNGKWTKEEDQKLEEAIRLHGYCWAKVASCVFPRLDSQCRGRWKHLFPDDAVRVQAERMVAKTALPNNFVGRVQDRSTLGVNDFVAPVSVKEDSKKSTKGARKKREGRQGEDVGSVRKSRSLGRRVKKLPGVEEKQHDREEAIASLSEVTAELIQSSMYNLVDPKKSGKGARKKRDEGNGDVGSVKKRRSLGRRVKKLPGVEEKQHDREQAIASLSEVTAELIQSSMYLG